MALSSSEDKVRTKALNNAYMLLRIRPRSEREVRDRLRLKGYSEELVGDIISGLKKTGEIDDLKFATFWIESRMHLNPAGDVVLKHELKHKGVEAGVIECVLKHKADNYDEYAIALSMAEERFRRFSKIDRPKALKRVYDFMLRRGFKYDTVQRIISELTEN
ncbi:MAG: RecX family transcriptional regulator [Candidatus Omnitrophica bacterium]|nr:RecX family transcriptional regulator [Candidatus Omnitrophota bacterium]